MPKQKRYTFIVSRKPLDNSPMKLSGFLDMLRYDAATVIDADTSMIVLQTTRQAPTMQRWHSLGIYILADTEGDYPDIVNLRRQAEPRLP
jgi:hypothetical protein